MEEFIIAMEEISLQEELDIFCERDKILYKKLTVDAEKRNALTMEYSELTTDILNFKAKYHHLSLTAGTLTCYFEELYILEQSWKVLEKKLEAFLEESNALIEEGNQYIIDSQKTKSALDDLEAQKRLLHDVKN